MSSEIGLRASRSKKSRNRARVYLDHAATSPLRPDVVHALRELVARPWANPSSVHEEGRAARREVETAREAVARLAGCQPEDMVFTSSGTEANALFLSGVSGRQLLVGSTEHDSVLANAPDAQRLPVDGQGCIRLEVLRNRLAGADRPCVVSVMAANNETGVIQPLDDIATLVREHEALLHCDAVQALGRLDLPPDAVALGLSGHKIGAPQGVGALILREEIPLQPPIRGSQERRRRGGTENLIGIAGFGAAASALAADCEEAGRLLALRTRLEAAILDAKGVVLGHDVPRLPGISAIALPGVSAETQVMWMDLAGLAVSAGAACSSGKVARSHVLEAMGLAPELVGCTIRVSLGWSTTEEDIDNLIDAWIRMAARFG